MEGGGGKGRAWREWPWGARNEGFLGAGVLAGRGQGRSTVLAWAQGVGVQGPGPASRPGLFLAPSSLAEAAVYETVSKCVYQGE